MPALDTTTAARARPSPILGSSPKIRRVREQVRAVAAYDGVSVLVLGETGTGKELVAEAVHRESGANGPFVAVNCAAIPEHLVESELFGHEAGAFTGARGARAGLLEEARGGTLFLDEVSEMPLRLQPKLLRALEARTFRRLGSNRDRKLEARVLSASNRADVGSGSESLRTDLYYRLAAFRIELPPLRERREDVPELAMAFLKTFQTRHDVGPRRFTVEALQMLERHDWPGNVRELKATVEQAAIIARGDFVTGRDLELRLSLSSTEVEHAPPLPGPGHPASRPGIDLRQLERELILREFRAFEGNVSRTARRLGIPRTTLRARLKRYGEL